MYIDTYLHPNHCSLSGRVKISASCCTSGALGPEVFTYLIIGRAPGLLFLTRERWHYQTKPVGEVIVVRDRGF